MAVDKNYIGELPPTAPVFADTAIVQGVASAKQVKNYKDYLLSLSSPAIVQPTYPAEHVTVVSTNIGDGNLGELPKVNFPNAKSPSRGGPNSIG